MDMQTGKTRPKFGSKNCPTRSAMFGQKRPHVFTTKKNVITRDDKVIESLCCSWCGVPKWTSTSP